MTDIIWGNGSDILSPTSFILNVTHRKNGNKENYLDVEKIKIIQADIPGLPHSESEWNEEILKQCTNDAFLKCEIEGKDESGFLLSKVSHSGVGGY
ncbi:MULTISPECIES: hypothetical protein [Nitrosopumilus]|uniref:Uncharacterized protein n=1 Tax=Nitrosopumilus piranensis TaxID=1582439 RepID=A0A0C5BZI5_9ARCH|nr:MULTISPECIES: hypothetical protein [Nitrosopumilus]AJM92405.1 hypothetical protein NPIRD3C_1193 [Nitrosopumilus piranensis]KAF6244321.1 hypothetical protein C6989_08540 [Nitrosopumilus sp. b2]